jgi:transposase InsO family protein
MAEWIEEFYNPLRRQNSLNYLTPNEYEALHSPQAQAAFS